MSLAEHVKITITQEPYGRPIDPKDCPDVHNAIGAIRSIDVSHFPMKMRVEITRVAIIAPTLVAFAIRIVAKVVERDQRSIQGWHDLTGPTIEVVFTQGINMPIDSELPSRMRRWVRDCLREAVAHELDECLLFDGFRLYDPHAGER